MNNNKYDAIICDLGNVLVNFDHRIAVRKILECTPKGEEEIYDLFFDSGLTEAYEEGKISRHEFFNRVKDALELNIGQDVFMPIWNDIFFEVPLNKKMHEFLRGAKGSYKLIMMSNLNESHFEFLKPRMLIFREFDKLILSYQVGYRKPASEIYKIALDFAEIQASKAFYIDDRRDLVDAAARLGIKGIVFDGNGAFDRLVKELTV
ncbi:MAG: HAD-IA family hydrolase [Candidatus Omnitrophica bacterium]|nr:HAD-IA family hydrolase [Candidatus Omnitrophota bacterium]